MEAAAGPADGAVSSRRALAVVRRAVDVMNERGDFAAAWAPDVVWHAAGIGEFRGIEAFSSAVGVFAEAFPDYRIELEGTVTEGNLVAARFTTRATHTGPFMGIQPTGRPVEWVGNDIYRVEGDRIAEEWFCEDLLSVLRQVGAVPA